MRELKEKGTIQLTKVHRFVGYFELLTLVVSVHDVQ